MKGSAYAGFVAWGLAALGAQALGRRLGARLLPLAAALALAPLLVAAWAQALTIADHWRGPAIFTRDIAAFDSAAAQVPPGATIAVTSDAAFTGPISGQLIASLYGRAIWGHLSTAYTSFDDWPAGRMPQYALLAATERPWPLDYRGRELWRSGTAALYRLDDTTRVLHGRSEFYSSTPATDRGSPAALAIWRRGGANRVASHAQPLTIAVGDMLHFGRGPAQGAPREQQLRLTVASLVAQTVALSAGDRTMELSIAPGVSRIDLRLTTPAELTIAPDDGLALIDAIIRDPDGAAAPARRSGRLERQRRAARADDQPARGLRQPRPARAAGRRSDRGRYLRGAAAAAAAAGRGAARWRLAAPDRPGARRDPGAGRRDTHTAAGGRGQTGPARRRVLRCADAVRRRGARGAYASLHAAYAGRPGGELRAGAVHR